jgi:hypothetical protein
VTGGQRGLPQLIFARTKRQGQQFRARGDTTAVGSSKLGPRRVRFLRGGWQSGTK